MDQLNKKTSILKQYIYFAILLDAISFFFVGFNFVTQANGIEVYFIDEITSPWIFVAVSFAITAAWIIFIAIKIMRTDWKNEKLNNAKAGVGTLSIVLAFALGLGWISCLIFSIRITKTNKERGTSHESTTPPPYNRPSSSGYGEAEYL